MNFFLKYPKEILIIKFVTVFWFFTKIYSYELWISNRLFPTIPVFDFLNDIDNNIHLSLYLFSLFSLVLIFFKSNSKTYFSVFLIFEISSCLLDYNRWQPWEYMYLLIFAFHLFSKNKFHFLKLFTILICFTYIYSGIHKINGAFLALLWEDIILRKLLHISFKKNIFIHYLGLIIPLFEISIGIGLLVFNKKKYSILSAIIFHLFIIYFLSPIGISHNFIVIPWNILMIFLIILIFYDSSDNLIHFKPFYKLDFILILLVCILPMLNYFKYWDDYLSFNLYSGNNKILFVQIENLENYPELKKYEYKNKYYKILENATPIHLNSVSMEEIKVPIYESERTFLKLKNQWNKKYSKSKNHFYVFKYPFFKKDIYEI